MGYSNIKIIDDPLEGELLIAEGEARKGSVYIARITGPDPTYRYARDFIGHSFWVDKHTKQVRVSLNNLDLPEIFEICVGGSWKNRYRGFYLLTTDKELKEISEKELREALAQKLKSIAQEKEKKIRSIIKLEKRDGE